MKTNFVDESGKSHPILMGCYGIGVTRTLAAAIEQNHDADGIIWPKALAPYQLQLVSLAKKDETDVIQYAETLYSELLKAGVEVLYDDRDLSPGAKFKDADLLGIPFRIVVGQRGLSAGELEFVVRQSREKSTLKISGTTASDVQKLVAELKPMVTSI
jgi:prolyl-tRNA synthetase